MSSILVKKTTISGKLAYWSHTPIGRTSTRAVSLIRPFSDLVFKSRAGLVSHP